MNNLKQSFRTGLAVVAGLVAWSSCTDTWDDHYGQAPTLDYEGTMMQALEEKASDFASVVKAYGYDRELASENVFTVWAPVNGTFNVNDYFDVTVDENGNEVRTKKANAQDVVDQFIMNHIARYSLPFNGKDQKFTLINKKNGVMSGEGVFGTTPMDVNNSNIATKNGILHTLNAVSPYNYNLFEIIKTQYLADQSEGKDSASLYAYLYDERYNNDSLIENKSVSRGVDEMGNKIWVDSFTMRNNTVLKNIDAKIYEEDSSFWAIIPSARAWQERYDFAAKLLNFNPSENRVEGTTDSLRRHYANTFAMTDLFFNKNANEHYQDSLKSTLYGSSYWYENIYYPKAPKDMPEDKDVNDIFAKCGEPIECSNGTAYFVDEYPFSPYEQFFKTIHVNASGNSINLDNDENGKKRFTQNVNESFRRYNGTLIAENLVYEDGTPYNWRADAEPGTIDGLVPSESEEDDDADQDDEQAGSGLSDITIPEGVRRVRYEQKFAYTAFQPSGTTQPKIAFNIRNTLSGKYDIYMVTCPAWLNLDYMNVEVLDTAVNRFMVSVYERDDKGEYPTVGTRLINQETNQPYFFTSAIRYNERNEVMAQDTVFFGTHEFKNAYYGRNDGGVIIQISSQCSSKDEKAGVYTRTFLINCLILKPHREGEEPIVVPMDGENALGAKAAFESIVKMYTNKNEN